MPEQREPYAMELQLKHGIESAQNQGATFHTVQALWCDATATEANRAKEKNPDARFARHLVDKMDASCSFKRGQTSNQTPLFPPQLARTPANPNPDPITTLGLKGPHCIRSTARALILDLGPLNLMVCSLSYFSPLPLLLFIHQLAFLTHCHVNLYTRSQWEDSICQLPSQVHCFFFLSSLPT